MGRLAVGLEPSACFVCPRAPVPAGFRCCCVLCLVAFIVRIPDWVVAFEYFVPCLMFIHGESFILRNLTWVFVRAGGALGGTPTVLYRFDITHPFGDQRAAALYYCEPCGRYKRRGGVLCAGLERRAHTARTRDGRR